MAQGSAGVVDGLAHALEHLVEDGGRRGEVQADERVGPAAELLSVAECNGGLGEEELEQTRNQVKGQMTLSLESTSARLYRLAGFALYDEPFLTLDELLAKIDAVTAENVAEVAGEFFSPERQFSLRLGP